MFRLQANVAHILLICDSGLFFPTMWTAQLTWNMIWTTFICGRKSLIQLIETKGSPEGVCHAWMTAWTPYLSSPQRNHHRKNWVNRAYLFMVWSLLVKYYLLTVGADMSSDEPWEIICKNQEEQWYKRGALRNPTLYIPCNWEASIKEKPVLY